MSNPLGSITTPDACAGCMNGPAPRRRPTRTASTLATPGAIDSTAEMIRPSNSVSAIVVQSPWMPGRGGASCEPPGRPGRPGQGWGPDGGFGTGGNGNGSSTVLTPRAAGQVGPGAASLPSPSFDRLPSGRSRAQPTLRRAGPSTALPQLRTAS